MLYYCDIDKTIHLYFFVLAGDSGSKMEIVDAW